MNVECLKEDGMIWYMYLLTCLLLIAQAIHYFQPIIRDALAIPEHVALPDDASHITLEDVLKLKADAKQMEQKILKVARIAKLYCSDHLYTISSKRLLFRNAMKNCTC